MRNPLDILGAEPLWRATWIDTTHLNRGWPRGYWFPPITCSADGWGRYRPAVPTDYDDVAQREGWNERIYSSPRCRCDTCLANAQAIDIMLHGIAWVMLQWPDAWEHRCFVGLGGVDAPPVCTCGARSRLDVRPWRDIERHARMIQIDGVWHLTMQTTTATLAEMLGSLYERIAESYGLPAHLLCGGPRRDD